VASSFSAFPGTRVPQIFKPPASKRLPQATLPCVGGNANTNFACPAQAWRRRALWRGCFSVVHPAALSIAVMESMALPKTDAPPLSGAGGRGGFLFGDGFFAFEVSDAALAFFAFVVLFAHIFFTLL
jgi:hypothetical protein